MVAILGLVTLSVGFSGTSAQAGNDRETITICHATDSYSNPYVELTVDQDSADGDANNDNGQGDHYLGHNGPLFSPDLPKHTTWGDIIPPIPGVHDGLNWTSEGQAIYNNGCNLPPTEIPVPTVPVSDPCGPNNAVYGVVPSGNYTVTRNNNGSITVARLRSRSRHRRTPAWHVRTRTTRSTSRPRRL